MSVSISREDIAVISGYSEQKRLLMERIKENWWNSVKEQANSRKIYVYKVAIVKGIKK